MLSPLDAISLASAIVQFVDLGSRLVIEGYGVYRDGSSHEHQEIEDATARLRKVTTRLQSRPGYARSKDDEALSELSRACEKVASELITILEDLKVNSQGPMRTWEALKKTIKGHVKADDIAKLRKKLEKFQRDINTQLLAIMSNGQSETVQSLRDMTNILKTMQYNDLDTFNTKSDDLKKDLQSQKEAMKALKNSVHKAEAKRIAATQRSEFMLCQVLQRLSLLEREAAAVATAQRILDSLTFPEMHHRHRQIHKEHINTFSWIFDLTQTPFRAWLGDEDGIFWISGKAGSGKSTLMKFLVNHEETSSILHDWASTKKRKLTQAKCFFWNAGSSMQKSQEGLLQSLAYQVLAQRPELISVVTPRRRWDAGVAFHRNPEPWELDELLAVIKGIVDHGADSGLCFCFCIDGLDEYSGDHGRLVDMLDGLTVVSCVKLCVSSRPWNVFREAYDANKARRLYVHQHTQPDMERYVKDQLEDNRRFKTLVTKDPRTLRLASEIRDRAEGVFLWVFLVVRRLSRLISEMQGMKNDQRLDSLENALREMPSDLDEYFAHMIKAIEPEFRKRTAGLFMLAIHGAPLPLIASHQLSSVMERPDDVLTSPVSYEVEDEVAIVAETIETVNACCKDLLEVCTVGSAGPAIVSKADAIREMDYRIDFLHRTVRDFLMGDAVVQRMFQISLDRDFDPQLTLTRLYLAQLKRFGSMGRSGRDAQFSSSVRSVLLSVKAYEEIERKAADTRLLEALDNVGAFYCRPAGIHQAPLVRRACWPKALWGTSLRREYMASNDHGPRTLIEVAVAYDLFYYVQQQLLQGIKNIDTSTGALLLYRALAPAVDGRRMGEPSYDMVVLLVQGGANPNFDSLRGYGTHDSAWAVFLRQCYIVKNSDLWPFAKLLLQYGADPDAKFPDGTQSLDRATTLHSSSRDAAEIPSYITATQALFACCSGDQIPEMKRALKEARLRKGTRIAHAETKVEVKRKSAWLDWARKLAPRPRKAISAPSEPQENGTRLSLTATAKQAHQEPGSFPDFP